MKREQTSWKVLLMPLWILSMSFGMGAIMLMAAPIHGMEGAFAWACGWMLANIIPTATLFQAYEKERWKRREIEMRWRKEQEQQWR